MWRTTELRTVEIMCRLSVVVVVATEEEVDVSDEEM